VGKRAGKVRDTYGLHLTLRVAAIEDRVALGDPIRVDEFLRTVVDRVGMTVLAGPMVATEHGPVERAGVSGVVILHESHAAVHTYPALGEAFVDLFSCRRFGPEVVLAVLGQCFGAHHVREQSLRTRGRHWDADVAKELAAWGRRRGGRAEPEPSVRGS
jgi:S-adenosylmethionine decarboxylase